MRCFATSHLARCLSALVVASTLGCNGGGGFHPWSQGGRAAGDGGGEFYEDNPTYLAPATVPLRQSTAAAQQVDQALLDAGDEELKTVPQALSFLVVRHGFLVKESYFHGSAADQSNNIHSASKGVLSALVGIALKDGHLQSLDQTVAELLPQATVTDPVKRGIKLRDLLTMSAGFQWTEDESEYNLETNDNWVQAILDLPLATAPGKVFNYCTGQSHLVSAILTQATGMSTSAYANQSLFQPLGISDQHWGHDPQGYSSGGYNLYMTPRALTTFALMAANKGSYQGHQFAAPEWFEASWKPWQTVDQDYTYGYYWWLVSVAGHPVYKLWGYGGQYAVVLPEFDALVVMTANTAADFAEMDADSFLARFIIPAMK